MANYVNTNVRFYRANDEAKAVFNKLCERLEGWGDPTTHSFTMSQIFGIPETDELDDNGNLTGPGTYSWNIENIGAKWCFIEDVDDDGFRTESAWSVPYDGIQYILEQMAEADPKLIATVTYEDEMPNFFGWATWHSGSYDEGREWEWEEFEKILKEKYPVIAEGWNEEEQEWTDEAREQLWDVQWEEIYDLQQETLDEELKWLEEHEDELESENAI